MCVTQPKINKERLERKVHFAPPPSPSGARRCPKLPGVQGADLVILLDSQGPHPCDSKLQWAPASPLLAWSCLGKPRDLSEMFAGAAEVVQV